MSFVTMTLSDQPGRSVIVGCTMMLRRVMLSSAVPISLASSRDHIWGIVVARGVASRGRSRQERRHRCPF